MNSSRKDKGFKLRLRSDEGLDERCPRHIKLKHIIFYEVAHVDFFEVSSGGCHIDPGVVQSDPKVMDLLTGFLSPLQNSRVIADFGRRS